MKIYFDKCNNRLVCIDKKATPDFWDKQWSGIVPSSRDKSAEYYTNIMGRYLDPGKKILEGGCGLGTKLQAFKNAGYQAVGIDFAEETVEKLKSSKSYLEVHLGDVRALPFENESFDGYWSLGVIEHFWEGYSDIIGEVHRVLREGGYLFLTFPQMSLYRKCRSKLGFYKDLRLDSRGAPIGFYQFMLDRRVVIKELESRNFEVVWKSSRGLDTGMIFDNKPIGDLLNRLKLTVPYVIYGGIRFFLRCTLGIISPHVAIIVARKC